MLTVRRTDRVKLVIKGDLEFVYDVNKKVFTAILVAL